MVYNPAGFISVADGGVPRLVGGIMRGATSGGMFVFCSGATGVVSSGTNSFVTSDILFAPVASGNLFNGLATVDAGSNVYTSVATRGMVIVTANNTVTAGNKVWVDGADSVADAGSVAGNVAALRTIGRAFTAAASGGYCLVDLHG